MSLKYMHTLNGEPARYIPNTQIVYGASRRQVIPLADSLEQIRAERKAARKYRKAKGWDSGSDYGYITVDTGVVTKPDRR